MLSALEYLNFKLDLNDRRFCFQRLEKPNYADYRYWSNISEKILNIRGL